MLLYMLDYFMGLMEMGSIFKKNENYVSGSVPIILWVGAAGSGYFT